MNYDTDEDADEEDNVVYNHNISIKKDRPNYYTYSAYSGVLLLLIISFIYDGIVLCFVPLMLIFVTKKKTSRRSDYNPSIEYSVLNDFIKEESTENESYSSELSDENLINLETKNNLMFQNGTVCTGEISLSSIVMNSSDSTDKSCAWRFKVGEQGQLVLQSKSRSDEDFINNISFGLNKTEKYKNIMTNKDSSNSSFRSRSRFNRNN